ncbi:MAG TPA: peptidoglycan recognition family protein [Edaphobacter sp.]|jgi:N-acetyl-anhydromuramyl-L-alanine amidase AmpD|nr:peptidoglycan recognition family protein [Edaphobacter sp.]
MPKLSIVNGIVCDSHVKQSIVKKLDHGPLTVIHAIVVHQTDSSTAQGTIAGYNNLPSGNGAHFLIDKDGKIYQTVPLNRKAQHVGYIYAKCFQLHKCVAKEKTTYEGLYKKGYSSGTRAISTLELKKAYPSRYPMNFDSIGIEIVSKYLGDENNPTRAYEQPTPEQQASLHWLVTNLLESLNLQQTDVYRHPQVSNKTAGEARDAQW